MAANVPVIIIDDDEDEEVQITGVGACAGRAPTASGGKAASQHLSKSGSLGAELARAQSSQSGPNHGGSNGLSHHGIRNGKASNVSGPEPAAHQALRGAVSGAGPYDSAAAAPPPGISGYIPPEQAATCAVPEAYPHSGIDRRQTRPLNPPIDHFTFTPMFFNDMADQIMLSFPSQEFAARHGCSEEHVDHTLIHTVISSLIWEKGDPNMQVGANSPSQAGHQEPQAQDTVPHLDSDDQFLFEELQRAVASPAENGNSHNACEKMQQGTGDTSNVDQSLPAVDPQLVDPELMLSFEAPISISDSKPANNVENPPPACDQKSKEAAPEAAPVPSSNHNTKKRRRSDAQGESGGASHTKTSSQQEGTLSKAAESGVPSPPKKAKNSNSVQTTTVSQALVPTTTAQPPYYGPQNPIISAKVNDLVSSVSAAILHKADNSRPKEESHLRRSDTSRRRRVVRDPIFGNYVDAPPSSSQGNDGLGDTRKESSSKRCERQPREKTLYEVATAKDKEIWEKYFKDPCSRMPKESVVTDKKGREAERPRGKKKR